jgi:hypothetical protein
MYYYIMRKGAARPQKDYDGDDDYITIISFLIQ